uniref:ER membrane protein complex subunit 4 n=1 Tax=Chlamydomonas euryale TaxID=1486919 RepID=A0A7R9Z5B9_9CHLO|mmetsp:Transcript_45174/g.134865  ORF Transcript_45174/g.134865 Transcript_45174/m.134865 type:complete len:173 (+) Transcript_45174:215-733(+)
MATALPWKVPLGDLAVDSRKALDPPGYDASMAKDGPMVSSAASKRSDPQRLSRKQQMLFAKATAPLKQIGFMCFMAWMSGNGIQIFSILMTFNLLSAPIQAIISSGMQFPKDEDMPQLDTLSPRLVFCAIQLLQLGFGLYKLDGMGLLPLFPSDWISTMSVPPTTELSCAAM